MYLNSPELEDRITIPFEGWLLVYVNESESGSEKFALILASSKMNESSLMVYSNFCFAETGASLISMTRILKLTVSVLFPL